MPSKLFNIRSYLTYWLDAVDQHSLHSPFFFDLYTKVIKPVATSAKFEHIEKLRNQLLQDHREIRVLDFGARDHDNADRKISDIARKSLSPIEYSALYLRIAEYCQARTILELGTCFGINTLYLAEKKDAEVITFEGAPAIASIAELTFEFAQAKNIRLIQGNINTTLPGYLHTIRKIDMAFIDANHRYAPTVKYFELLVQKFHEKSVLIVDDIHYSEDMEKAWAYICQHRLVYSTADLFRCGLAFFDPSLNKQHVILQV